MNVLSTFSEYLDVGFLAQVVGVDEWRVVGIVGLESNVAPAARMQQNREDGESFARRRLSVDYVPNLRTTAYVINFKT